MLCGGTVVVGADDEDSNGVGVNPSSQTDNSSNNSGAVYVFVRTAGDAASVIGAVQEVVWDLQPLQSFYQVATVDQLIAATLAALRFSMTLLAAFAAIAVLMAAGGIYSVISFSVSRRTRSLPSW